MLQMNEKKEAGFQTKSLPDNIYPGIIGKSKTMLRSAGRANFNTLNIDVITCGEFIEKDKKIKIVKVEGNKVFVEEVKES